ncbi:MAG: NAD(P)H-dependent oxidoreductase [Candidatus Saccharibacteria bacterium]|nr:NAD(P)H-dependent oxidoreductase [Candidatus Saccharibacteria bacterium]
MAKIAIIVGSTRPNRVGAKVADWFYETAKKSQDAEFEVVDLIDYKLPILDEPTPGATTHENSKKWSAKIAEFDGFVFVTPEYNHGIPGSFKNAIDFLNREWQHKPVSYVSYGVIGGHRAVEQHRQIAAQFKMYDLREQVSIIAPWELFDESGVLQADETYGDSAERVIEEISFWSNELKPIREKLQKD